MNEQLTVEPLLSHIPASMWMCCSPAHTAAQAEGSCPKWFFNGWGKSAEAKTNLPIQRMFPLAIWRWSLLILSKQQILEVKYPHPV